MREQALLSDKQNPFLWQSEELECVESWLGVLMCRAGGETAAPHGRSAAVQKVGDARGTPRRRSTVGARHR